MKIQEEYVSFVICTVCSSMLKFKPQLIDSENNLMNTDMDPADRVNWLQCVKKMSV